MKKILFSLFALIAFAAQAQTFPVNNLTASGYIKSIGTDTAPNITPTVLEFGADQSGISDSSGSFQAAINSLPSEGGTINVPPGTYLINTAPTWGTKSINWNFDPSVIITGSQTTFPAALTNTGVIPVGPWIISQSVKTATATNGTSAFTVEAMQPATLNGGVSAFYGGVNLTNGGSNSIGLAQNLVATAQNGSSGNIWGSEIDVGMFAPTNTGTQFGLSLNGLGSGNPTFGIKMQRADSSLWQFGLDIRNAVTGINIENTTGLSNAIVAGGATFYPNTTAEFGQMANSIGDVPLLLQRNTDSSPVGMLLQAVNKANSQTLFDIDVFGNVNGLSYSGSGSGLTGTASSLNIGGHAASDLSLTGGSLSGQVTLSYSNPGFYVNDSSGSNGAYLFYQSSGSNVWGAIKSSGTNGSYLIQRYISGSFVDNPISISNTTGVVTFADGITANLISSALGTPNSGVITNLSGTCASCNIGGSSGSTTGNAATATTATNQSGGTVSATTLTASSTVTLSPGAASVLIKPLVVQIAPTSSSTMDNVAIGLTTPSTIAATTLSATGAVTLSPASANVAISPTGSGTVTINPATASAMNNVSLGQSTPLAVGSTSLSHTLQELDTSYAFSTPTTGTTVTLATGTETAILAPAGTLAALTVTLPGCTSGYNGSIARFSSTQTITSLTVNATSGTVADAPTTLALGAGHGYLCRGSTTTWYQLY